MPNIEPMKHSPKSTTHWTCGKHDRCCGCYPDECDSLELAKTQSGMEAVKIDSVPKAEEFNKWLFGQGAPIINGEDGWAWLHDYKRFKNKQ